jgi:hypothetical protein
MSWKWFGNQLEMVWKSVGNGLEISWKLIGNELEMVWKSVGNECIDLSSHTTFVFQYIRTHDCLDGWPLGGWVAG